MATRRAVIAGGGALAAAIATSAAALSEAEAEDVGALRQLAHAQGEHRQARSAYARAVAAFVASIPEPHWSINGKDRNRALCGRLSSVRQSRFAELSPSYMPTFETLDSDLADCARYFPGRYDDYCKLTRRLKARVKRRQQLIKAAEERFRLDELELQCDAAQKRLVEFADRMFEAPAQTLAAVRVQAQTLTVFAAEMPSPTSWPGVKAGQYGNQLAKNLLALQKAEA